jgi:hypothetical protein
MELAIQAGDFTVRVDDDMGVENLSGFISIAVDNTLVNSSKAHLKIN